tara:strand:- start:230 stop:1123 length:894 start_codon:yes stop_codon:yes gene_type:complete
MATTKVITELTNLNQANSESGLRMPTGGAFSGAPAEGMMRNDTTQSSASSASTMQHYTGDNVWKNFVNVVQCTTATCNYPTTATALYQMENDGGVGNSIPDTCGNYNGTEVAVTYTTGKFGNAASFNGSSSEIDLGNSQVFSVTQTGEISFSLWINSTDSDGGYVFAKGDDVAVKYEQNLYLNTNGTLNAAIYNSAQGTAASVTTTATVNDGNWHHVVVTIDDGSSMSIYVDNGTPVTTTSWSGTVAYESTVPFFLGAFEGIPASSSKLNGKLDQVRVFPSVLTASQVTQLYNEVGC